MARIYHRLDDVEARCGQARRVEVVLDRVAFGDASNYLCHISFRAERKKSLDIYADKRFASMAIDDAFDRLNLAIKSGLNRRIRRRCNG